MSEGRIKILEMLQEGKVSVQEAMELLKQFPEEAAQQRPHVYHYTNSQNSPHVSCDCDCEDEDDCCTTNNNNNNSNTSRTNSGFGGLGATITNFVSDALDAVDDLDINVVIGGNRYKATSTYTSDPIVGNINSIKVLGKNAPVTIQAYDGNFVKIVTKYNAKRGDSRVFVQENNGNFELLYDYNSIRYMSVECFVPRVHVGHIHGETKNSKIEAFGLTADNIDLMTKNSKIEATSLRANHLDFKTSNSKIEVEDIKAKTARLITSNSKISTDNVDIEHLYVKTSNGAIKLENIFNNIAAPPAVHVPGNQQNPATATFAAPTERIIEAQTSNASVTVDLPPDAGVKLQASTSNGRVECNCSNMVIGEMSKTYLSGHTANYDSLEKRVKLNINTSNGSVKVR